MRRFTAHGSCRALVEAIHDVANVILHCILEAYPRDRPELVERRDANGHSGVGLPSGELHGEGFLGCRTTKWGPFGQSVKDALEVLYLDQQVVAVNKPAGLLVHRTPLARGDRRVALQIVRNQLNRQIYPVHRLDRATSGVLLFALCPQAAQHLARAFAGGEVHKRYLAIVRGHTEERGSIDLPLREEPKALAGKQAATTMPMQPAYTVYQRLAKAELPIPVRPYSTSRYSLVEAVSLTGRTHQIRRHLKHIAHPIIGDTTHGDGHHNRMFWEWFGTRRLLLMAIEIRYPHPEDRCVVTVRAPLDEAFRGVACRLGWDEVLQSLSTHADPRDPDPRDSHAPRVSGIRRG